MRSQCGRGLAAWAASFRGPIDTTPFLPFKAFHSHRQTARERRREEQGKVEEKSERHENYLSFLPFAHLAFSSTLPGLIAWPQGQTWE